ncbi:hypothetical protein BZZ01_13485 [Nostocales cyanobacterium HT-58-2]|nr:hypothetical protein BZZ01_13485 [Nostocales cyanobacterium HT-58-2]
MTNHTTEQKQGRYSVSRKGMGGREKKYGTFKTKAVRIPEHLDAEKLIKVYEGVQNLILDWEDDCNTTSPRYQRAKEMLEKLKELTQN